MGADLAAIAQRWEDLAIALAVWAYALVSLFVLNVVKVLVYRAIGHTQRAHVSDEAAAATA